MIGLKQRTPGRAGTPVATVEPTGFHLFRFGIAAAAVPVGTM